MSDQVLQIARRIRELREISDYSVGQMAEECGVSLSEYEGYESGKVDIPISFLLTLAERFHVDMTEMLTGEAPRLRVYSLTRAGKGVEIERRQHYIYKNLAYNFVHRKVEPLYVTVLPGTNSIMCWKARSESASTTGSCTCTPEIPYTLIPTIRTRCKLRKATPSKCWPL